MLKRKHVVIVFLTVFLTIAIFMGATTSQLKPYDPWFDYLDDGKTNYEDLFYLADRYGATGTPINKTELLLNLNATVEALETRIPKKGYISVPASAFVSINSTKSVKVTNKLYTYEPAGPGEFVGSVQLPNGVTVTNVTFYWYASGGYAVQCALHRYNQTHDQEMAYMQSSGSPGYGSSYPFAIWEPFYEKIDNQEYAYHFYLYIPYSASHTDYFFQYVTIEYEYPA